MWVPKLLLNPIKIRIFCPKNDQIWPKIGIFGHFGPGHAGLFGALLVSPLVVVARGLYLASHLFTLLVLIQIMEARDLTALRILKSRILTVRNTSSRNFNA